MTSLGMRTQWPAGPWVRATAPSAFLPCDAAEPVIPWPWAGIATATDGRTVVLARHEGTGRQLGPARTSRTVCIIRVPGAHLPTVIVASREGVRLRDMHRAVPLESEMFNTSLWASGPDEAGIYAVLHARSMSEMLRRLPDGATAVFHRDYVAVYSDELVLAPQLLAYVAAALAIADLIPSYLVSRPASRLM